MLSAVSAQGQLRFMLAQARVTAAVFFKFTKDLMFNASAPIFPIVDGYPTHRAKQNLSTPSVFEEYAFPDIQ